MSAKHQPATPRQLRYVGNDIDGYLLSLWDDGKVRLTSLRPGKIVRTFRNVFDAEQYRLTIRRTA